MRYRPLGRTGMFVSELCLGTMTIGGQDGMWAAIGALTPKEGQALVERALAGGVNLIDTADVYAEGRAEEALGAAIKALGLRRSDLVVATKVFGSMGKGPNDRGASRGHIHDGVRRSLDRLGLDHIDLYQIHGDDPLTPVEETARALDDLVRQGLVRYVGVSNWAAWKIMKAQGAAARLGFSRFETLQAYYSIAGRDLERELAPMLTDQGMGLLVWSPLAGGLLSGKFGAGSNGPPDARRAKFDFPPVERTRAFACVDAMRPMAQARGVTVARIALAYILAKPFVTSVIIGAKTLEQLDDNLAASDVVLETGELEDLDAVSALPREYPGWMLERQAQGRAPGPFTPDKGAPTPRQD